VMPMRSDKLRSRVCRWVPEAEEAMMQSGAGEEAAEEIRQAVAEQQEQTQAAEEEEPKRRAGRKTAGRAACHSSQHDAHKHHRRMPGVLYSAADSTRVFEHRHHRRSLVPMTMQPLCERKRLPLYVPALTKDRQAAGGSTAAAGQKASALLSVPVRARRRHSPSRLGATSSSLSV